MDDESAATLDRTAANIASTEEVFANVAEVTDVFSKPEAEKKRFRVAVAAIVNGEMTIKVCAHTRAHAPTVFRRRRSHTSSPQAHCTRMCTRRVTCSAIARHH